MGQILKDVQLFDYGVLNGVVKMKNNNLFAKIDEETNVIIYQILVSDVDLFENTIKIITNLKHENLLQIKAFNYEK